MVSSGSKKTERGKMQTDMEGKEVRIFMKSESFHVFVEQEEVAEKYKMSRKLLPACLYLSERK